MYEAVQPAILRFTPVRRDYFKALCGVIFLLTHECLAQQPLRRANSFFGLHFDFHATLEDTGIGRRLTESMVDSLLANVRPDFVQVDCKGHPGISSYPTQVGNAAPLIFKDPLKLFRDVTLRHHVALYVHYSGVKDAKEVSLHPGWASIDESGVANRENASVFGPYVDSLLIPQLTELANRYKIDGAWVDGDCWALRPDYSPYALKAWHRLGNSGVPHKGDSSYFKFIEFNRSGFRAYLAHYVDKLHAAAPGFQIASNWSYSSMMPEKVDTRVDYLSGDLASQNCMNSGAFEARCLAPQGRPWDLMAWGFTLNWEHPEIQAYKTALQLEQEAAEVIAMGGGFQIYLTQARDASLKTWLFPLAAQVAGFVRARQPYCQYAKPVHQIALLYPTDDFKRNSTEIYNTGPYLKPMLGLNTALLDGQHTVEIRMEHSLTRHMKDFGLIVVPECSFIKDAFKAELLAYAKAGGSVLLIGSKTVLLFEDQLGVKFTALPQQKYLFAGFGGRMTALSSGFQPFMPLNGTQTVGGVFPDQDMRDPLGPVASIKRYGKGMIGAIYANLGGAYITSETPVVRDLISAIADTLFVHRLVRLSGSHLVHVTLNDLRGRIMVNLINTDGQSANPHSYSFDQINPLSELTLKMTLDHKPAHIIVRPGKDEADWTYDGHTATIRLHTLELHCILEIS